MGAVGGSIESVTLDGRYFAVAADSEGQRKIGGFENELQMNGDGTGRIVKTRIGWSMSGLTLATDDDAGDAEFLQELANRNSDWPATITFASGLVYQGRALITGEVQTSSQNATTEISLMGAGTLTPQ